MALPAGSAEDPDALDPAALSAWLSIAAGSDGTEHAVLSDGFHRIRLDVAAGSLAGTGPVVLHYELAGIAAVEPKLLPLRRLLYLCRHRRFAQSLFVRDTRAARWIMLLRAHDAQAAGATQREMAAAFFGSGADWRYSSDSLRSRVRRLARDARAMAAGGYRRLLRAGPPDAEEQSQD